MPLTPTQAHAITASNGRLDLHWATHTATRNSMIRKGLLDETGNFTPKAIRTYLAACDTAMAEQIHRAGWGDTTGMTVDDWATEIRKAKDALLSHLGERPEHFTHTIPGGEECHIHCHTCGWEETHTDITARGAADMAGLRHRSQYWGAAVTA